MTPSTTDDLLLEVRDKVLVMTFNRPDKLNAMSGDMIQVGIKALEEAIFDKEIGAVMLTGAGRAFCAGGDVSSMGGAAGAPMTYEDRIDSQRRGHHFSWLLHSMPKVTIAAVNGHAVGAGIGMAMSCDLRLASEKAKFGTAFARVGFGGDYGTSWQLTRLVGQAKAKELFFLPDIIQADEALRIGLANRVLGAENFVDEAHAIAAQIANGPLVSYRYMKENVNMSLTTDFKTILDREAMTHLRCGQTDDHKEGIAAFMEKREPVFQGR